MGVRRVEVGAADTAAGPPRLRAIPLVETRGRFGDGAWFRPDGSLEKLVTAVSFDYEGIPVAGGPEPVEFTAAGRLRSGRLARDVVLQGRSWSRGTSLRALLRGRASAPR